MLAQGNMPGRADEFVAAPFFWNQHYNTPIKYVGYKEKLDELAIERCVVVSDDALLRVLPHGY